MAFCPTLTDGLALSTSTMTIFQSDGVSITKAAAKSRQVNLRYIIARFRYLARLAVNAAAPISTEMLCSTCHTGSNTRLDNLQKHDNHSGTTLFPTTGAARSTAVPNATWTTPSAQYDTGDADTLHPPIYVGRETACRRFGQSV